MSSIVVVGANWGDEGKAESLISLLSKPLQVFVSKVVIMPATLWLMTWEPSSCTSYQAAYLTLTALRC